MRILKKIWNFLSSLFVAGVVLLAIALVGVRVVGLTPLTVLSGSMEPTYHVGSLIYVKAVDYHELQVGDPITFVIDENLTYATHRIVEVVLEQPMAQVINEAGEPVLDENGQVQYEEIPDAEPIYYFRTKGDANDVVDGSLVYYKNVVGKPVFTIPKLGYFSDWIQSRQGMYIGGSIALAFVLLMFLPDILNLLAPEEEKRRSKKRRRRKKKSARSGRSHDARR